MAKNLGGQVKAYDEEYEKMPIDVQVGVSKRFGVLPFRVSLTMDDLNHWDYKFINHFILGIDILISQQLYIAGGYNFRHANDMGITDNNDETSSHGAAFSFGAGLQLERFKVQVGYGKYHVSSNSILVNVSYNF